MKLREVRDQVSSLRNSSDENLHQQVDDLYRELFNLRMRNATRQLDNDREIPRVRRMIARVRTIMRERQLARELTGEE